MIVKKFFGESTRDALRQVRATLGPDALILSNRAVPGGVEIMAVTENEVSAIAMSAAAPEPPPATFRTPPRRAQAGTAPRPGPTVMAKAATPAPSQTVENEGPDEAERRLGGLLAELRVIRSMLEGQLAGFAWSELKGREPVKLEVMRVLLTAGFSPLLSRQIVDAMPGKIDFDAGLRWARAALVRNLPTRGPEEDLVDRGGVYALVGPTGVGKTTTVAKLAARATLRHGPAKLALITTDTYRIGAHEQLAIYGKILNVPVYSVKDETDLALTLSDLADKHLVLIDTVGMSQRDRRIAQQIALLCGHENRVKRLLLLAATCHGSTLEDVVQAYRGQGLAGAILTKVDEAPTLGPVLDVVIRHRLSVHYLTNGQRVPEDLHLPHAAYLVDRALRGPRGDPAFTPHPEELPLAVAARIAQEDLPAASVLGAGR